MKAQSLTAAGDWAHLNSVKLPRLPDSRDCKSAALMELLAPFFKGADGKSLLELGCAASAWLPYFARTYGVLPCGVDYSPRGAELARENLRLHGLPDGNIAWADILSWRPSRGFDYIFSYGVLEHFDNPQGVLESCSSWLSPGGTMITLVPNLGGFNGLLLRMFYPEAFRTHRSITAPELARMHEKAGLEVLESGCVCPFSLGMVPWSNIRRFPFRNGSVFRDAALRLVSLADSLLGAAFRGARFPATAFFSPHIIAVAQKPEAGGS